MCDSDQFEKQQVGSLQGNRLLWAVWYRCPHDARSSDSAASRWHRQLWVSARAVYLRDWAFSDLSEFSLCVLAKGRYGFYWFACSKNRYYGLVHGTSLGQTAIQIFFKKIKNWVFLFLFLPLRSKYFWGRCSSLTQKKNSLFVAILEKRFLWCKHSLWDKHGKLYLDLFLSVSLRFFRDWNLLGLTLYLTAPTSFHKKQLWD